MAFSTLRGRPRKPLHDKDPGTPELRLKHALQLTSEPIDICLERKLITHEQHWCGLHLRWLYTVRYGAPILTTNYTDRDTPGTASVAQDPAWREMREREYSEAVSLLRRHRFYECVMRLAVFNERPSFLSPALHQRASCNPVLARQLHQTRQTVCEGLELLTRHWQRGRRAPVGTMLQQ